MYFAMLFIGWNPHQRMHKYGSSHKFERTLLLDVNNHLYDAPNISVSTINMRYVSCDIQVEYWCWLDKCVGENCKWVASGGPLRWVLKMRPLKNSAINLKETGILGWVRVLLSCQSKCVLNKGRRNWHPVKDYDWHPSIWDNVTLDKRHPSYETREREIM